jgi:hypothetical protein
LATDAGILPKQDEKFPYKHFILPTLLPSLAVDTIFKQYTIFGCWDGYFGH